MTRDDHRGFTLVEVLVAIAIVAVLIGLLLAAVQRARAASARARCLNNLKQLALAAHDYHNVHGRFPPGLVPANHDNGHYAGATNLWVELLPHVEQTNLQGAWDYNDYRNTFAGGAAATSARVVPLLLCPSDPLPRAVHHVVVAPPFDWVNGHYALGCYGGNAGTRSLPRHEPPEPASTDGVFYARSRVQLLDIRDGTGDTLLLGERSHEDREYDRLTAAPELSNFHPLASFGAWSSAYDPWAAADVLLSATVPINYRVSAGGSADPDWLEHRLSAFGSGHPGGANFAFADGSVRFVRDTLPLSQLRALGTRAGGEVVELP